jgi:hypothetical protein
MHIFLGWPKGFLYVFMLKVVLWCVFLCHKWVFCTFNFFVFYIICKSFVCVFLVPFMSYLDFYLFLNLISSMSYVGFFCWSSCQLCLFYLCVLDIIHVPFFLLIFYIGLSVFYVGCGALDWIVFVCIFIIICCYFNV